MRSSINWASRAALAICLTLGPAAAAQQTKSGSDVGLHLLANRIWMETTPTNGLPGVMMTFLSNGTLLQGSCWEGYILSNWKSSGPRKITWKENETAIFADVVSISTVELVLETGVGNTRSQHIYLAAKAPFICPDMKK